MMDYRNARYTSAGDIDCEVDHPSFGWIPFTASPDDTEKAGRDLFAKIEQDGSAAAYVPPDPVDELALWRQSARTTRTEFCVAAKRLGMLTPDEAILAAQGGWPQSFSDALNSLPVEIDAAEAQIVWAATTEVHRNDPVLNAVAAAKGFTPEQIDNLFR